MRLVPKNREAFGHLVPNLRVNSMLYAINGTCLCVKLFGSDVYKEVEYRKIFQGVWIIMNRASRRKGIALFFF